MIENEDVKVGSRNTEDVLTSSQLRLYNKMKQSYDYRRVWNGKDYKYSLFSIMIDLLGKNDKYCKYIEDEELVPVFRKILNDYFK